MAGACVGPSPKHDAPDPNPVVLRLIRQESVPLPLGETPQYYAALAGPDDGLWLCAAHCDAAPQVIHRSGGRWGEWQPLAASSWCGTHSISVEPDAAGRPVVVWIGRDCELEAQNRAASQAPNHFVPEAWAVVATRWTRTTWTPPIVVDRANRIFAFCSLPSLRDKHGRIHAAYSRKLDPPEEYSVGWPVVDGESPGKCAHVIFDGENWSKPRFTTDRGRFDLRPLALSEGPSGVVLACEVHEIGLMFRQAFLEYQVFDGQTWGGLIRVVADPQLAACVVEDAWGHRLITYTHWNPMDSRSKDHAAIYFQSVWGEKLTIPPDAACQNPIVTTDAAGRIALLSGQKGSGSSLRVWNGAVWSKELTGLPETGWLRFGRSHSPTKLLLVNRESQHFVLYEIAAE